MNKQYQDLINSVSFKSKDVPLSIYSKVMETIETKEQRPTPFDLILSLFQPRRLTFAFAVLFVGIFSSSLLIDKHIPSSKDEYLSQFYFSDVPEYMISFSNQL
ncbi:MAG: hypothetical protein A2Y40_10935 [Candidatus Margulisbacteria bacterium GWF2_35_9]|nr:MAG: hypothetical protein A2Y40_10935 [Candidatus Margulisbacteria bacterium GWF2_35_9]